jgi:hypothetical protein
MKSILRVKVNDDGTLQLPADDIVRGVDGLFARFADLLPRARPPAAVPKVFSAIAAGGVNANRQMSAVDARLLGFSIRETTGAAAATIELRAGTDATGDLIIPINLGAGESAREWYGPDGVAFTGGLYLVRVAGTVDGSIWLGEV